LRQAGYGGSSSTGVGAQEKREVVQIHNNCDAGMGEVVSEAPENLGASCNPANLIEERFLIRKLRFGGG
jgi:hypothetical protein